MIRTIEWTGSAVVVLDQRLLPTQEVYQTCGDFRQVAEAIRAMVIRGAPAIGIAAAMGIALGVNNAEASNVLELDSQFEQICNVIACARPTAVNLFWAVERMKGVLAANAGSPPEKIAERMEAEARAVREEDVEACRAMGRHGAALLPDTCTVLTHCNAGALATADYGTALGVIRGAAEAGKKVRVYADETRPFLQGARLTAWELMADGIDVTLICDNMAGHLMKKCGVDAVIVGADRIAANGDAANKIGTYPLSIVARAHGVPFYVAAPLSTIDLSLSTGEEIPIEERKPEEVACAGGVRVAPQGVKVWNPSFDVTPAENIAAIVTERGVARPPYRESLAALFTGRK